MGLLSAGLKLLARTLNDSALNRDMKTAKNKSYRDTKKSLQQAKRKGYYINETSIFSAFFVYFILYA